MYCGQCGAEISSGNQFCGHCGAPMSIPMSPPNDGVNNGRPGFRRLYPIYPPGSFRTLFLGYMWTLVLFVVFSTLSDLMSPPTPDDPMQIGLLILILIVIPLLGFFVASLILFCYLLYRCWAVIQDGDYVETTPGLAVGLNFIPFFNFYWAFVSQLGLAKGMNDYCRKRSIQTPEVSEGLAIVNSLMVSVGTLSSITVVVLMGLGLSLFAMGLSLVSSVIGIALEYFLYARFAETAEVIQQYKIDQMSSRRHDNPQGAF